MATIKVACPKCGQKVSGDESFFGSVVECPICTSEIRFPGTRREEKGADKPAPPPPADLKPAPPGEEGGALPRPVPPETSESLSTQSEPPLKRSSASAADDGVDEGPDLPPSPIYGAISIVSAVLGVVTCVGGVLFAPLAIIFGHTALAKARHSPIQPAPGHTLGAIGLMVGYVNLVFTILVLVVLALFGESIREAIQQRQG